MLVPLGLKRKLNDISKKKINRNFWVTSHGALGERGYDEKRMPVYETYAEQSQDQCLEGIN